MPIPAAEGQRVQAVRWLPSGRSILTGLCILLIAGGGYLLARETSIFALREIEVQGASPGLAARIRGTLAPLLGSSLVKLDRVAAERRLAALPEVAAASFDRAFPHTLRIAVRLEQPVALLRQGDAAWAVSPSGRVLREVTARPYPALPRIWLSRTEDLAPGVVVGGTTAPALRVAAALSAGWLAARVMTVRSDEGELTLVLQSGAEIRLGHLRELRLKLAIAARIIRLAPASAYVDVSVPERSVAGYNPQVGG